MTTPQSLLFFDIDGTLITEDDRRYLPDSARSAIRQARSNGHLCFINTGRTFLNLDSFIREVGFDGYICGCGTYIRYKDEILLHHRLSLDLCKKTSLLARQTHIYSIFEAADHNAIDQTLAAHPQIVRLKEHFAQHGHPITMFVDDHDFSFDKFTIWYDQSSDLPAFQKGIAGDFDYIHRGLGFGEIIPHGYSKATGIAFLEQYFHIAHEHCYALGDSANDFSMLDYVQNSIAMGNSSDEVKERVAYVTRCVEEDGLAQALAHYGLITHGC